MILLQIQTILFPYKLFVTEKSTNVNKGCNIENPYVLMVFSILIHTTLLIRPCLKSIIEIRCPFHTPNGFQGGKCFVCWYVACFYAKTKRSWIRWRLRLRQKSWVSSKFSKKGKGVAVKNHDALKSYDAAKFSSVYVVKWPVLSLQWVNFQKSYDFSQKYDFFKILSVKYWKHWIKNFKKKEIKVAVKMH